MKHHHHHKLPMTMKIMRWQQLGQLHTRHLYQGSSTTSLKCITGRPVKPRLGTGLAVYSTVKQWLTYISW